MVKVAGPMISDMYYERLSLVNKMSVGFNCAYRLKESRWEVIIEAKERESGA